MQKILVSRVLICFCLTLFRNNIDKVAYSMGALVWVKFNSKNNFLILFCVSYYQLDYVQYYEMCK